MSAGLRHLAVGQLRQLGLDRGLAKYTPEVGAAELEAPDAGEYPHQR